MTEEAKNNIAASVRQRLLNIAREQEEDFNLILTRYGLERILYRLSQSKWQDQFLLKGAMLFMFWHDEPHRPTRDADFLGLVDPDIDKITAIFQSLCSITVDDDGLIFDPETVREEEIRENNTYEGIRVKLTGKLENANIVLQFDIGFGDVVTPDPEEIEYPTLLDQKVPKLKAYPVYTVIAEKFEAIIRLGMINTRMKDFYDLWILSHKFELEGQLLMEAIKATFNRRKTEIPKERPIAFSEEFYDDVTKKKQWLAFLNKNGIKDGENLKEVISSLEEFLMPIIKGINLK
jgi:predicted nucleotidyltransferase component of viral defense system